MEQEKAKAERWARELKAAQDKIEEQQKEIKIRERELEVSHATYEELEEKNRNSERVKLEYAQKIALAERREEHYF